MMTKAASTSYIDQLTSLTKRRYFLQECGVGLGSVAAALLLERDASSAQASTQASTHASAQRQGPLAPRAPHFPAKAKQVIYMFQAGAPSHLELFDHKPELTKRNGQLPPAELLNGYRAAFIKPNSALLGPKFKFKRHGQSGMELSEVLPHISSLADDICLIRSMQTDAVNHAPAQMMMNTGSQQFGRPSFGAWTLYGLGSQSEDLPGFVVLTSAKGTSGGASNYGCGFLPTMYGGIPFRNAGDAVLYLSNPPGIDQVAQRESLDAILSAADRKARGRCRAVVVAGCLAQRHRHALQRELPEVDAFVGLDQVPRLGPILTRVAAGGRNLFCVGTEARAVLDPPADRPLLSAGPYAFVRLADGCNHRCAFCAIPLIRGRHRSRRLIWFRALMGAATGLRSSVAEPASVTVTIDVMFPASS